MRSVAVRVTVLAAAVLVASLAIALVIAYELLFVAGRDHLDATLTRERVQFQVQLDEARGRVDGAQDGNGVRSAFGEYLRLNPGSETYFAVLEIDGQTLTSRTGPDTLLHLAGAGQIPLGTPGRIESVDTSRGQVRVLTMAVPLTGDRSATFAVAGSLDDVRADTFASLRRLAVAAGISLVVGSVVLAFAARRAFAPLRAVASAAKATNLDELDTRVPEPRGQDEVAVLAQEFNRMLARLSVAADARREFLAAVSHELRTPLTIARGHLDVFATLRDGDPAAIDRTTRVLRDELRHMGRLVDDLMTLERSTAPDFVQLSDVSLREFFDDLELRITGLDIDGIELHAPADDVTVRADADRLAQAVLNLVVNADRHTPPGTHIVVRAERAGTMVTITVADDGPGIDPVIRERMFEPFVTSRASVDRSHPPSKHRPSGLGLAVVAAVVDAHRGEVAVDSDSTGTRIALSLPAVTAT